MTLPDALATINAYAAAKSLGEITRDNASAWSLRVRKARAVLDAEVVWLGLVTPVLPGCGMCEAHQEEKRCEPFLNC